VIEPTRVLTYDRLPAVKWLNIAIKVALVATFAVAIIFEPSGAQGKGMEYRAPAFLGSAIGVPIIAIVRGWRPFPHTADALLASPFLLDTLANTAGFYERFNATDDVLHLVNWILLVASFHAFRFRNVHHRNDAVLLGYGVGGLAIIWWEGFEWLLSTEGPLTGDGQGLALGYTDTVGDLILSSSGGLLGSVLAISVLGPVSDLISRSSPADLQA
jgi:hypothetical protein